MVRMNNRKHYTTEQAGGQGQILYYRPYPAEMRKQKPHPISIGLRVILILVVLAATVALAIAGRAEETVTRWALCKPGDRVNLRLEPSKSSRSVGWLECGDSFQTDGTKKKGWIRVLDAGECECWIYSGYVAEDEPEAVFENYVCVAKKWVACRRWVNGPQVNGKLRWLHNGSSVNVFYIAGKWAVTSRGYIRSEWLEVDPV
jgi:hypothetical protein